MKTFAILTNILLILMTNHAAFAEQDPLWSAESNGLRARLIVKRWKVTNGSGIIATYAEFQNDSDSGNAKTLRLTTENIVFRVTDADGNEIPKNQNVVFSGREFGSPELVLPMDSVLKFRMGPTGHGIGGDLAAHLDLGSSYCWGLSKRECYLSAVLDVEKSKKPVETFNSPWHGRIEFPPVLIPMASPKLAPDQIAKRIEDLGNQMIAKNRRGAERAFHQMSLIDDPRVVDWYVKAVKQDIYDSKCKALDRLGYFQGDLALEGLTIGINTQGKDIANVSRREIAKTLANNVRHYAVKGLARSPHPKAKSILLSFHDDASETIRLSVVQAAARIATKESIEIVRKHVKDKSERVSNEAARLLKLHDQQNPE